MIQCSILTIGDEICIGQIVNTNAAWIAAHCSEIGCEVIAHSIVGDDSEEIKSELKRLSQISDYVFLTGGLGPTHDDVTKKVLCEYFNDSYIWHEPTLLWLQDFYARRGRPLTERNKLQAFLPSVCEVLSNERGTAPGMLFQKDGTIVVSMPGVPREMMYIMEQHIFPRIEQHFLLQHQTRNMYRTLMTIGVAESDLADMIGDVSKFLDPHSSLAFLPSYSGVRLRIGAHDVHNDKAIEILNSLEKILRQKAGKFIYGSDNISIEKTVAQLLTERGETVSVAESCTGGKIGAAFTDLSGSSAYFIGGVLAYSNTVKVQELGVKSEEIEQYGAVSEEVARSMSQGVRHKLQTDYGIAATGVAGPDGGSDEKPVGTVWISLSTPSTTITKRYIFGNDRAANRDRTVGAAFDMLYRYLKSRNDDNSGN